MLLPEPFETATAFERVGIRDWLFGGNAVELVTGREIRPHDEVGLFVVLERAERGSTVLPSRSMVGRLAVPLSSPLTWF